MTSGSMLRGLSRERWKVVERLLDAALDLDPAQRVRFLDEACVDDPALAEAVRSLLSACDNGAKLFERPAAIAFAPLLAKREAKAPAILAEPVAGADVGAVVAQQRLVELVHVVGRATFGVHQRR